MQKVNYCVIGSKKESSMKRLDIVCMGTALVDCIIKGYDPNPVSATGFRASSCSLNVGGEAVNEAVTAARLGMNSAIMCFLGEDAAGDMIMDYLHKNLVDTSSLLREKEHPTPVTTMFVNDDGSRKSITNEAHRYNFHPEKYPEAFTCSEMMILGSLFRAPFNDPAIIRKVCEEAVKAHTLIFADTKLPNFVKLTLDDIADSLPMVDFITPNEDEAKYYTGREDPSEMADVFLSYGVKNVIIKLGAKGFYFKNRKFSCQYPAYDIQAVDATGAGDSFVAAFASELLRRLEELGDSAVPEDLAGDTSAIPEEVLKDCLMRANACAAICTTEVGATTALKNRQHIGEFMDAHPLK